MNIGLCKVEFNQPSCCLYSEPNLLVFQQLVALYLGGIPVFRWDSCKGSEWDSVKKCSRVCKKNRDSWLDLAGDSRLQATRSCTRARHAKSWSVMLAGVLQNKIGQLAIQLSCGWNLRLSQAARPSREPGLFWKTWLFTFHSHPSINTPYTHKKNKSF